MDTFVFTAVLLAAAMHAGWNAIIKTGLDRFSSVTLISLAAGVVSLLLLPFVPRPGAGAWPLLLFSAVLHTGYKIFLVQAYRTGDMGQVYPIARGAAPLLVAIAGAIFLGEELTPSGYFAVFGLVTGVCLMSARGGRELARIEWRAVGFALGTSILIAGYTMVDGVGARLSGSPHGFAVWLFVLDASLMLVLALLARGPSTFKRMLGFWRSGLAGGAMSLGSYWIAIWAMTMAPIALVAAVRETSVLSAALISVVILREPLTIWRCLAAVLIMAGVVATRIA